MSICQKNLTKFLFNFGAMSNKFLMKIMENVQTKFCQIFLTDWHFTVKIEILRTLAQCFMMVNLRHIKTGIFYTLFMVFSLKNWPFGNFPYFDVFEVKILKIWKNVKILIFIPWAAKWPSCSTVDRRKQFTTHYNTLNYHFDRSKMSSRNSWIHRNCVIKMTTILLNKKLNICQFFNSWI